jgi:hypothetical protein
MGMTERQFASYIRNLKKRIEKAIEITEDRENLLKEIKEVLTTMDEDMQI